MFSLLRNKIEDPSYKRGLALNSAMLISYGIAFQLQAIEGLAPDTLTLLKYIALAVAIIISFRAMAERRVLRETQDNYVSMLDASVISLPWQMAALGAWVFSGAIGYVLFFRGNPSPAGDVITFGLPLALFNFGAAYALAARNWVNDPH